MLDEEGGIVDESYDATHDSDINAFAFHALTVWAFLLSDFKPERFK